MQRVYLFGFVVSAVVLSATNAFAPSAQRVTHLFRKLCAVVGENPPDVRNINSLLREHPEQSTASSMLISDVADYGIRTALAEEHLELGNFVEALKLAKEAIDMADHTHESDNIYSAYAEGIMADALYGQGNFKESAEHFKSALKSYERHYRSNSGPEAVELVGAMQLVAWNALSKKDYEEALLACQTALGMTEKLMGPKNADVAACMVNLAIARLHNGDTGEGTEALLLKAFTIYDEIKIQNPEANVVSGPLSTLYTALGDLHNVRGETMMARNSYEKVEKMFQKGKVSAQQARGARKSLLMMDVTSEDADNEDNMRSMIDALERDLDHFKRGK